MIRRTRYFLLGVMLIAAAVALLAPRVGMAQDHGETDQAKLIAVLTSADSPKADKAITCKRLAIYGDKEAVPALAALLPDPELTSWARIALEAIPGPEADAALRDSLDKTEGRTLIGVINSIGVRSDAGAVDALTAKLKGSDAEVASAAAAALGKIGTDPAAQVLTESLANASPVVRSAVAEGCIYCAEKRQGADAAKLYDAVRAADVPKTRKIEATRGAILARGDEGIPLLLEQLRSDDKNFLALGLTVARELPGAEATKALVAEMDTTTPERQALLIFALADRGDAGVLPVMLEAVGSDSDQVRSVALGALARLGDVSCVPTLLSVAAGENEELAAVAQQALADLPDSKVNADLVARLPKSEGTERSVLIKAVGQRRVEAAVPELIKAAGDSDVSIRQAALTALGEAAGQKDLAVLIAPVVDPKNADDTPGAVKALRAAAVRMPDREACAAQLVAAMQKASVPAKCSVLEILGAMEGSTSLKALEAAAKSSTPELQDTASRLLGEWMNVDAAPVLLDLAKNAPEDKYKVRAMRGYIRMVRQFVLPDEERVAMCRAALQTASRNEEKLLVLEVMERYPSVDMLRLSGEAAKIPAIKNEAAKTTLVIAQKIGGKGIDVQQLLAQIGQEPVEIEIIKAEYGAGDKQKDVTEIVKKCVRDLPLIVLPSESYNAAFGGDPAGGVVKELRIRYRMNGKEGEATFTENAVIMLPTPK